MATTQPPIACSDNDFDTERGTTQKGIEQEDQSSKRLCLLTMFVIHNTTVVLLGRYTRSSSSREEIYDAKLLVVCVEAIKLFLSCVLEHFNSTHGLVLSLKRKVIETPMDALKLSIPALLFFVQNICVYTALTHLSAPLFQVSYQCKLITTTVASGWLLSRRYELKHWLCLAAISVGVAIVVLSETEQKKKQTIDSQSAESITFGLLVVMIGCFCSSFAGVYFERVLKQGTSDEGSTSLWMRNIQLAFFSIIIGLPIDASSGIASASDLHKLLSFRGFTPWVWTLAIIQAVGGLLVALVIQHADNVLKGLATGVSVALATIVSRILLKTPIIFPEFPLGAVMIISGVYLFNNDIPQTCQVSENLKSISTGRQTAVVVLAISLMLVVFNLVLGVQNTSTSLSLQPATAPELKLATNSTYHLRGAENSTTY